MLTKEVYSLCQSLVISIFSIITSFSCAVDNTWNLFYNYHPLITIAIDYGLYCIRYAHSVFNNYNTFPFQSNWVSLVHIDEIQYEFSPYIGNLNETYYYFNTSELQNVNYINYFIKTKCKLQETKDNSLLFLKLDEFSIIRNKYSSDIGHTILKVRNPFLSISYHHPNMNEPIDLNLDKCYFIQNNEILSACFILMFLSYQSQPYYFDNKYTIKLMDNDLNEITLQNNQFIRLLDKGYEIVTLKK